VREDFFNGLVAPRHRSLASRLESSHRPRCLMSRDCFETSPHPLGWLLRTRCERPRRRRAAN
jgi:hypothetical protein